MQPQQARGKVLRLIVWPEREWAINYMPEAWRSEARAVARRVVLGTPGSIEKAWEQLFDEDDQLGITTPLGARNGSKRTRMRVNRKQGHRNAS